MTGAYWPRPWACEDGGPRRTGCASGLAGLRIQPDERLEVAAVHDAFGTLVEAWVERLDPAPGFDRDVYYQSLTTIARVVVA